MNIISNQYILIFRELILQFFGRNPLDLCPLLFLGQDRPSRTLIKVTRCVTVFPLSCHIQPSFPLEVCKQLLHPTQWAFGYVGAEMAHNLYFIRPWYNWWQWGKVMPSGSFPPDSFPDKIFKRRPSKSRCRLDTSSRRARRLRSKGKGGARWNGAQQLFSVYLLWKTCRGYNLFTAQTLSGVNS